MKRATEAGLIALLLLFSAACNDAWLRRGPSLYGRDVVGHLLLTEKFHYRIDNLLHGPPPGAGRTAGILALFHEGSFAFHGTYMWPKLAHLGTAAICVVAGLHPRVMIQCNMFWLGVLSVSLCAIGRRCGSPPAGLFAAALAALYPAFFGQSRKFGLDFPLTAMTALAIFCLIRAGEFRRIRDSILLGAVLGLGILTKGQLVLYLAGPFAFAVGAALVCARSRPLACLARAALAVGIALAVSSCWWWGITRDLWRAYFGTITDYPFSWAYAYQRQVPLTLRWFLFHAFHGALSISPLFTVAFLIGLPGFVRRRIPGKGIILTWLLCGYALWTASNIKRDTDLYPCLPAIALMTAFGIVSWRSTRLKRIAVAGCLAAGVIQYLALSFSPLGYRLMTPSNPYGKPAEPDGYSTPFHPPYANNYGAVMADIAATVCPPGGDARYARIGVIEAAGTERWEEYSTAILEFHLRLRSPDTFIYRSRHNPQAFLEHGRSFEYLIVMDRRNGPEPDWGEAEAFFGSPEMRQWAGTILGNPGAPAGMIESYRRYPVLWRGTLRPEGCGVYLCRKPPIPVKSGAPIPASEYRRSNLLTSPYLIGARGVPRYGFREADYDLFFPYWTRFPLVDGDLRYPGDPYFSEYALDFNAGGMYRVSARYSSRRRQRLSILWDGTPALEGAEPAGADGRGKPAWREVCVLTASPGVHTLRLQGDGGFPPLSAIRFDMDEPAVAQER